MFNRLAHQFGRGVFAWAGIVDCPSDGGTARRSTDGGIPARRGSGIDREFPKLRPTRSERLALIGRGVFGIGEGAEEGDEGGLIFDVKRHAMAGVFGQIGVKLRGALHA